MDQTEQIIMLYRAHLLLVELLDEPVQLFNVLILSCVCAAQDATDTCHQHDFRRTTKIDPVKCLVGQAK